MRIRTTTVALALGTVIAGVHVTTDATAQTLQPEKTCANIFDNEIRIIEACSALIQAGKLANGKAASPKVLGEWHFNRAIAYSTIGDYERAVADYQNAAPGDSRAPRNIYDLQIKLAWIRYLREIHDENDHANWSRPPFDAYWEDK